ncbi:MAG: GntR family transcriptional regulator [Thermodesulfovibrionales bacterium]|nr:GntR family transcriptional regulator [Thermodesulfovibrionales bacterium]
MGKLIDRDNPVKLYLQLADILKKRIELGEWEIGSQIPTEEELCKIYDVSRATVRLAISELTKEGYITKQQGKGTFVLKKVVADKLTMLVSFDELMIEPSEGIKTTVHAQTIMMPTDDLVDKLDVSSDKHIIYIKRTREFKDMVLLIQESFIPLHFCPYLLREDLQNMSLFEFFEKRASIHITAVKNNFEPTLLNAEEAKLFEYPIKTPAIMLTQQLYSGLNNIMFSRSVRRPGRGGFFIEFEKKSF